MKPFSLQSFRGGISDETDKGIKGSFKHGYGLEIHGRPDTLTCKPAMQRIDSGAVLTDLPLFFVPSQIDGSTYAFGDSGKIYSIAGNPYDHAIAQKYSDTNGKIKGAAEWQDSSGNTYLYWATDTSISRKLLPGDDAWGDVTQNYKTTLNSALWHTMDIASGQLSMGNGQYLATLDYTLSFLPAAMSLRPGNTIVALEEKDDYTLMGTARTDSAEEGHIWSWITTAVNWIQKKKIPAKGVNSFILTELPLVQAGNNGELFFSDFVTAVPVQGVPGGGMSFPGGVTTENGIALFGMFGGTYPGVWGYGRRRKNRPYTMNYFYRLAGTVNGSLISTIGCIAMLGGELLAAYGTTDGSTSEYAIDGISNTTLASARYESLEFDANTPHLHKKANTVKVTMSPMPASTSIGVAYKTNRAPSWTYALMGDGGTSYSVTNSIEAEFMIGTTGQVVEVAVDLVPSGNTTPEVLAATTYFDDAAYEFSQ